MHAAVSDRVRHDEHADEAEQRDARRARRVRRSRSRSGARPGVRDGRCRPAPVRRTSRAWPTHERGRQTRRVGSRSWESRRRCWCSECSSRPAPSAAVGRLVRAATAGRRSTRGAGRCGARRRRAGPGATSRRAPGSCGGALDPQTATGLALTLAVGVVVRRRRRPRGARVRGPLERRPRSGSTGASTNWAGTNATDLSTHGAEGGDPARAARSVVDHARGRARRGGGRHDRRTRRQAHRAHGGGVPRHRRRRAEPDLERRQVRRRPGPSHVPSARRVLGSVVPERPHDRGVRLLLRVRGGARSRPRSAPSAAAPGRRARHRDDGRDDPGDARRALAHRRRSPARRWGWRGSRSARSRSVAGCCGSARRSSRVSGPRTSPSAGAVSAVGGRRRRPRGRHRRRRARPARRGIRRGRRWRRCAARAGPSGTVAARRAVRPRRRTRACRRRTRLVGRGDVERGERELEDPRIRLHDADRARVDDATPTSTPSPGPTWRISRSRSRCAISPSAFDTTPSATPVAASARRPGIAPGDHVEPERGVGELAVEVAVHLVVVAPTPSVHASTYGAQVGLPAADPVGVDVEGGGEGGRGAVVRVGQPVRRRPSTPARANAATMRCGLGQQEDPAGVEQHRLRSSSGRPSRSDGTQ